MKNSWKFPFFVKTALMTDSSNYKSIGSENMKKLDEWGKSIKLTQYGQSRKQNNTIFLPN